MRAVIAMALACCVGLAASQPPAKGGRQDVQQQNPKASEPKEQGQRPTQGTEANPVFVKSLSSPESEALKTIYPNFSKKRERVIDDRRGYNESANTENALVHLRLRSHISRIRA